VDSGVSARADAAVAARSMPGRKGPWHLAEDGFSGEKLVNDARTLAIAT